MVNSYFIDLVVALGQGFGLLYACDCLCMVNKIEEIGVKNPLIDRAFDCFSGLALVELKKGLHCSEAFQCNKNGIPKRWHFHWFLNLITAALYK